MDYFFQTYVAWGDLQISENRVFLTYLERFIYCTNKFFKNWFHRFNQALLRNNSDVYSQVYT